MNWILECLQQLNVNELTLEAARSESSLFIAYAIVCFFIKRPVFLLAFFMCYLLINASFTQIIKECQVYLIILVMYSYLFNEYKSIFYKSACGILMIISVLFSVDAYFYGVDGYHGAIETITYNNIGSISLCSHLIFICSLINYTRIRNHLRGLFDCVERIASNGYNVQYILSTFKQKGS